MATTITPVPLRIRPARRLPQLFVGLLLYGVGHAMLVRANLGLPPWDVFHQGLIRHVPLSFGTAMILVGVVVLLLWIPLRQRPGFGTVANVLLIGLALDGTLAVLPAPTALAARIALLLGGTVLVGFAMALYIGSRLGPGPRDGLMTGLSARTGASLRLVRTCLEVAVLVAGWLLGGSVGVGTVLFAFSIGPLGQFFLRHLAWCARDGT